MGRRYGSPPSQERVNLALGRERPAGPDDQPYKESGMRHVRPALVPMSFMVAVSLACSLSPVADPAGPPESSGTLFDDDFSDTSSGWDSVRTAEGMTDYDGGAYRIVVERDTFDYWGNPGLSFGDVRVEVDATKGGGPNDNDFGVQCRYQDTDNFYAFYISSDGLYGIAKIVGGEYQLLGADDLLPSDSIRQGESTNHIRADCIGSRLTLYANGDQLHSAADDTFATGDVGLIAGTFEDPGADISFDNFVVYQP